MLREKQDLQVFIELLITPALLDFFHNKVQASPLPKFSRNQLTKNRNYLQPLIVDGVVKYERSVGCG